MAQVVVLSGSAASVAAVVVPVAPAPVPGEAELPVVAQVPHHTLSLWNNYQVLPRMGVALGVIYRSDMFAAIDNTVTLPGYTRIDAAAYFRLTQGLRLQVNVENLFDKHYWLNADSNTNISPGSPRAVRVGLTTRF